MTAAVKGNGSVPVIQGGKSVPKAALAAKSTPTRGRRKAEAPTLKAEATPVSHSAKRGTVRTYGLRSLKP
jgi:hypothetical protein